MSEPSHRPAEEATAERLARLEARLTCVEAHVGLASSEPPPALAARIDSAVEVPASVQAGAAEDEFEFEVGQNWFAKVGIVVLAIGVGFTLSLPFSSLPAGVPAVLSEVMNAHLAGFSKTEWMALKTYLQRMLDTGEALRDAA